jgi:hypothetical protein
VIGSGDYYAYGYNGSTSSFSYFSGQDYHYSVVNLGFYYYSTSSTNYDFAYPNAGLIDYGSAGVPASN